MLWPQPDKYPCSRPIAFSLHCDRAQNGKSFFHLFFNHFLNFPLPTVHAESNLICGPLQKTHFSVRMLTSCKITYIALLTWMHMHVQAHFFLWRYGFISGRCVVKLLSHFVLNAIIYCSYVLSPEGIQWHSHSSDEETWAEKKPGDKTKLFLVTYQRPIILESVPRRLWHHRHLPCCHPKK